MTHKGPRRGNYKSEFQKYVWELSPRARQQYAERAGTTIIYLEGHLSRASKVPQQALMKGLIAASNGRVSRKMLLDHFYPRDEL